MIGFVPQSIYLTDDTIRNNIAFGIDEQNIDDGKIHTALKKAQLDEFVETLPKGLDTMIGERGVRLSGGQRQRMAIARACISIRRFWCWTRLLPRWMRGQKLLLWRRSMRCREKRRLLL